MYLDQLFKKKKQKKTIGISKKSKPTPNWESTKANIGKPSVFKNIIMGVPLQIDEMHILRDTCL